MSLGTQGTGGREGSIASPILIFVGVIAAWEAFCRLTGVKKYILPSPLDITQNMIRDWKILLDNLNVTMIEILVGFALAFVVSAILGILLAYWSAFRHGVYPLIITAQTIPTIAIAPILVIWFGYNMIPRVLITALIAFFPLTVNIVTGLRSVDRQLVDFLRSLGATPVQIFFKLAIPTAAPHLFSGLKVAATLAVVGATVGEWVGADRGLGNLISQDTSQLNTVRVFSAIVVLSVCGIVLFGTVGLFERLLLPWQYSSQATDFMSRLIPAHFFRTDGRLRTVFRMQKS
jgi:NitT/TauT family transport system permease protein